MSDDQRKLLEQQLWNIANTLRGKMDADEFRDYILGFIFYKYLSEKMKAYADDILEADSITYEELNEGSKQGKQYLEAIREEAIESLGYFLKPSELFSSVARRGNGNGKHGNVFILEDLHRILNNIEQSTMGTESEDDFDHLFEDLDLTSTKLGRKVEDRNELISKVLAHLDKIDFRLKDIEADVLGDAYEYLISQFAAGAGKKAGEFYTPQEVSKVLAKLVTVGKEKLKTVYDPTCGSGSLLLRVAREVKDVGKFYGQELNRTTYNLARMNMILHGVNYQKFDIKQEDSLERPMHPELRAEAIVANPPFSAHWSANPLHLGDDRFSQYGRLAPSSKADWAFIQHMVHHLAENGTMAVVAPHGVLFRGGAEGHIRKYLIEDRNYLDAIIGLPANIFYGTSIPTCVLVLKRCKEHFNDILFINASKGFEKRGSQNYLRAEDIDRIISTYQERSVQEKYSYVATLDEVKENDYNLNILRYVNTFEEEESIDLVTVSNGLSNLAQMSIENDKSVYRYCDELGIPRPLGANVSLLQHFKQGVMQQIFDQEIRFKDDNGDDFPDWEDIPFHDIARLRKEKFDASTGESQRCVELEHLDQGTGKLLGTIDSTMQKSIKSVFGKGDILFGKLRPYLKKYWHAAFDGVCSTEIWVMRPSSGFSDSFLFFLVQSTAFLQAVNISSGSKMPRADWDIVSKYIFSVPTDEREQSMISAFLSHLDQKIALVNLDLDLTKTFKKDLLEQMFV